MPWYYGIDPIEENEERITSAYAANNFVTRPFDSTIPSNNTLLDNIGSEFAQYETRYPTDLPYPTQLPNGFDTRNTQDYGQFAARSEHEPPWPALLHQFNPLHATQRPTPEGSRELTSAYGFPPQPSNIHQVAQPSAYPANLDHRSPPQGKMEIPRAPRPSTSSETSSSSPSSGQSSVICPEAGCGETFTRPGSCARHVRNYHDPNVVKYACYDDGFWDTREDKIQAHCFKKYRYAKGEGYAPIINNDWSPIAPGLRSHRKKTRSRRHSSSNNTSP